VLPETPGQRAKRGHLLLSDAAEGAEYSVVSFYERDPKLLVFLHELGFAPGGRVRVVKRNYDQTLSIETPAGAAVLGQMAAEKVWVKRRSAR
jgi:DtxR family Mn-dependent transcriptional regulator